MVALLVLDLASPFFVQIAEGAAAAAREAGFGVIGAARGRSVAG
jgi:ABC-type sugar transport system substrate-binding protein